MISPALLGVVASGRQDDLSGFIVSLLHLEGAADTGTFTDEYGTTWSNAGAAPALLSGTKFKFGTSSMRCRSTSTFGGIRDLSDSIELARLVIEAVAYQSDFCVEFFLNLDATTGPYGIASHSGSSSPFDWNLEVVSGQLQIRLGATNNVIGALGGSLSANTWYHIAITRDNGTLRAFIDGTLATSATFSNTDTSGFMCFGNSSNNGRSLAGYIDEVRITKSLVGAGGARYTANFSPPTSEF